MFIKYNYIMNYTEVHSLVPGLFFPQDTQATTYIIILTKTSFMLIVLFFYVQIV